MNKRGLTACVNNVVSRQTPREGDGSPQLKTEVERKRTEEARVRHGRTLARHERRRHKRAGEIGLQKLIAYRQQQRGCTISKMADGSITRTGTTSYTKNCSPAKPARRHSPVKITTRVSREYKPEVLERRRVVAQLREIKRVFKKVLKFAMRQSKAHGHAFYLAILHLLCSWYQNWIPHNPQEAT